MLKFFRSRRPKPRAKDAAYSYKFQARQPELCAPCIDLYGLDAVMTAAEDMKVAHAWGLTLTQWHSLTDFERRECRRNITAAPRFEAAS